MPAIPAPPISPKQPRCTVTNKPTREKNHSMSAVFATKDFLKRVTCQATFGSIRVKDRTNVTNATLPSLAKII